MHKSLFHTKNLSKIRHHSARFYTCLFFKEFLSMNFWAEKEKAFNEAGLSLFEGDFPQSYPQILWTRILRFDCRQLASISILRAKM